MNYTPRRSMDRHCEMKIDYTPTNELQLLKTPMNMQNTIKSRKFLDFSDEELLQANENLMNVHLKEVIGSHNDLFSPTPMTRSYMKNM